MTSPTVRTVRRWARAVSALTLTIAIGMAVQAQPAPTFTRPVRYQPTAAEREAIQQKVTELEKQIGAVENAGQPREVVDDIRVFLKAGLRALRFQEFFDKRDVPTTLAALDRGLERARLARGRGPIPWVEARGTVVRGFTSRIDGSVQPYAVSVPEGLDLSRTSRARLDVVLHGRDQTISEARFIARFDGKPAPRSPDAAGKITLQIFGRGNNAYRWAGETDVFEAIEAVQRNYPIDDRRIVLRGFSMGGAGAWHLGLHHPSHWSSVEAGAGFTETKSYARLKEIPPYIEKGLHIYDSVDYALNAFNVPIVGYGGEDDPQLRASTNIVEALKGLGFTMKVDGLLTRGDGIDFLRVVGAKMGHKIDPPSQTILDAFHNDRISAGARLNPKKVRFTTYTLKYARAAWLSVEQLKEHYARTEVDANLTDDGKVVVTKAENVVVLALDRHAGATAVLGGQEFPLESAVEGLLPNVYFRRTSEAGWRALDYKESRGFEENVDRGKRRGLQGPIDDAFTGSFLVVAGTGTPWNPSAARWVGNRLERFQNEWAEFLRGDIRVKKDTELTDADIDGHHLILFGDPGSNKVMAQALAGLPLSWTKSELKLAGATYPSADHVPVLVAPNPRNPRRYVVLNTGPSFGTTEFVGTNALLYPHLGDHAVYHVGGRDGRLLASGYFDEGWSLKAKP